MYEYRLLLCTLIIIVSGVGSMKSSKEIEGYPAGYMPDCPGTNVELPIPPEDLKYLSITVQRKPNIFSFRTIYNYYQMKQLSVDRSIDFRRPTLMYVGGYLDDPAYPFALTVGVMYKKLGYNVLLLNTNKFTTTDYSLACRNIRSAGRHAAEMLATLTKYGLNPKRLELVGISLGGHTISFIAKNFRALTGMNISRITGLDPAGPCFRNLGPEDRLDQSDADFVDVIDTNIDGFGMAAPVGHVNYYVNGGEYQPGDILWAPCNTICSHIRSFMLWIAALQYPNNFIAIKCNSVQEARNRKCYDNTPLITNLLGVNADRGKPGIFYLATRNNYPYFMGVNGLNKEYDFFETHWNLIKNKFNYHIEYHSV